MGLTRCYKTAVLYMYFKLKPLLNPEISNQLIWQLNQNSITV